MLTSIGKFTKSFFVKIIVAIIILPFVFWGMGDVFRGGNQNIIATIDSEKLSTKEFMNYFQRLNITKDELKNIKKTNLLEEVLNEYIGRKIIDLEFNDMNVVLSDYSLKEIITNDKTFFKNNKFSRTEYEKFLLQSSLTAPLFEKNVAEQEKKRQLLSFLSGGFTPAEFLVQTEFKKENQIKHLKFIDLNNLYKNFTPDNDEIKKIYNKNKKIFIEEFKTFSLAELTPEKITGKKSYDEVFFKKIDEIENKSLDGISIKNISDEYNLNLIKSSELNKKQINSKGIKENKVEKELFNKIFAINKINNAELFNIKNKYYLATITTINKKNLDQNDKDVQKAITSQLEIKNKIEKNTKFVKDIAEKKFNFNDMKAFSVKNNLSLQSTKVKSLQDNEFFDSNLIKSIFSTKDGDINIITNSTLSKNFLVYTVKTDFIELKKNTDTYEKYELKTKLNFANDVYATYDRNLSNKYDVELNNKVINRIKNTLQ